jgi:methionyl-tRNA formyltransferase
MMKILLICSSDIMAIPAALQLKAAGLLAAIAIPAKHKERLLPSFIQVGFGQETIHFLNKETLNDEIISLLKNYEADTIIVITFPWKLSKVVLSIPLNGCFNYHPGLLPKYKGADPIFWQIKNMEKNVGLTLHVMTPEIDAGPIVMTQELMLIPGETYGILIQRIALQISETILKATEYIAEGNFKTQDVAFKAIYEKRPTKEQLQIDWNNQSATEIEALINASNPKYNGAYTIFRGIELAILEVSPADLNNGPEKIQPGTIVYADVLYGLVVACKDNQFLKINIVCMQEGYLTGSKLFSMGFRTGEIFGK